LTVKALVLDIDGTILNSKGEMTRATYDALLDCQRKGVILCIATSRSGRLVFRSTDIRWEHRFLLERGVYYIGGTVFDHPHHFYQHTAIPGLLVERVIRKILEFDPALQIALQHDNEYHSFRIRMPDEHLVSWGFKRDELLDFEIARSKPTTKMMIFSGTNFHGILTDLSGLFDALKAEFHDSLNIILADSRKAIYVVSGYASKGNAVKTLISLNNIKPEEAAVLGDDTPDIGMFGMFGYSIAMGNATDSLKSSATFVTKSNDEEGVVFALTRYLKII
jgi:Cof subfamily protein (haloacid dehalogenase superfamily)